MKGIAMLPLLQAAGEEGLTFMDVLSNVPHDAAAVVVYVLVGVSVGLVVWSGRKTAAREDDPQAGA